MTQAAQDHIAFQTHAMRLCGKPAQRARTLDVFDPYSGLRVGTVPMASSDDVRAAFDYAAAYQPRLSRYERAQILNRTGQLLRARAEEASDLISLESGLSKQDSRYEIGRVSDVLEFAALEALRDDSQSFACDLTPHGQYDKDYPDISGPRRSAGTFGNNQMQYLRLINAYRLDKNAALKSCSWGKFQILGENYGLCREHDVVSFVTKMATNEAKQLELFAVFIRNKMDRKNKREAYGTLLWHAVQQKDWENIARYYNGPKYKKYNYDTKLYQTYENMDKEG